MLEVLLKVITKHSLLLRDAVERVVIVEAEVTGVDDVVRLRIARELVQLPEIAYIACELMSPFPRDLASSSPLTSAIHSTRAWPICCTRP